MQRCAGLLDGLETQLAPMALDRPQTSLLEKGGPGAKANQRRNRLAAGRGARGDMPKPSFMLPK